MQQKNTIPEPAGEQTMPVSNMASRRNFLTKLTGAAAITAFAASCTKEAAMTNQTASLSADSNLTVGGAIGMGYGDIAILNYAYLLEQLESNFYMLVTDNFFGGISPYTKARLEQIRDHEIAHREFFKTALGNKAIPEIEFDFSVVDFSSRQSVLTYAKTFEDTGVSAYNGAGHLLVNPDYLLVAGKIVSVEARHASFLRSLLEVNSFANSEVIDANGLDLAASPLKVVRTVLPFIKTKMDFSNLPG